MNADLIDMASSTCAILLVWRRSSQILSSTNFLRYLFFVGCSLLLVGACPSYGVHTAMGHKFMEAEYPSAGSSRRGLVAANYTSTQASAVNYTRNLLEDSQILLLVKEAITSDPFNVTRDWRPIGKRQRLNACRWQGVTCNTTQSSPHKRVVSVNLADQSLQGTLSPSLARLSQLTSLNLSHNFFSGEIPVELTTGATSLETLDLGSNNLTGSLPGGIENLTNLTTLVLANNHLSGALPSTLGSLLNLQVLNISRNRFSGTIPQGLRLCAQLTGVDVSDNELQGDIPVWGLTKLTVLRLQNNFLSGEFLTYIATFTNLADLDARNNSLDGSIPSSIGSLPLRNQLSLAHNNLSGTIPDTLNMLSLLEKMDLSWNDFSGSIPPAVGDGCLSLVELNLSSNRFSGVLPDSFRNLVSLQVLDVSHNLLNGSLPTLDQIKNVKAFDASFNNFGGEFPDHLVNFSSLLSLNLSYNHLHGRVPDYVRTHDNVTADSFRNNPDLCGAILNITCRRSAKRHLILFVALGSVGGAALFLALLALLLWLILCKHRNRKSGKHSATVSAELQLNLSPEEVLAATKTFHESNFIGVGSMSTVYQGTLEDNSLVAVKRLAINNKADDTAIKALETEFETLAQIRHWSLVKVLGYCSGPHVKALVLEFMPNGSLDSLLYPPRELEVVRDFDWNLRLSTAIGVALSLKYLHHEVRGTPIVHGDLKPSNILFNTFMESRLGDFGVARILADLGFCPARAGPGTSSSIVSNGYTAPEVMESGEFSIKGDVYSYGIVLLEMMTGRSPYSLEDGQSLPHWVRATATKSKSLQDVLDPILMGADFRQHQQKMAMVLGLALLCSRDSPLERPTMADVWKMLTHIKTKSNDVEKGSRGRRSHHWRASSGQTASVDEEIVAKVPNDPIPILIQSLPKNPSFCDWTPRDPVGCSNPSSETHKQR